MKGIPITECDSLRVGDVLYSDESNFKATIIETFDNGRRITYTHNADTESKLQVDIPIRDMYNRLYVIRARSKKNVPNAIS